VLVGVSAAHVAPAKVIMEVGVLEDGPSGELIGTAMVFGSETGSAEASTSLSSSPMLQTWDSGTVF
jgi:hypothetical protein